MQPADLATMPATLLKRSDAPLWRLHLGEDWADVAALLCQDHCFDVHPVLVAPRVSPEAAAVLEAAIQALGTYQRNGWFVGEPEQAVSVLLQALPVTPPPAVMASPEPAVMASPEPATMAPAAAPEDTSEASASETPPPEPMDSGSEVEDPLLEFCEPCGTREASKAADVRATLEYRLGKARARALLSNVKSTVAQDRTGHKNKVLKLGSSLLKLKA